MTLLLAKADDTPLDALWEFVVYHSEYVIPIVAGVVVALILWAVLRGWRGTDQDALVTAEQKGAIIRLMRAQLGGVSPDMVAAKLSIDRFRAAKLLAEMEQDGKLVENTVTSGVTTYRLRGL